MADQLRATAFRGDPDLDELHSFFLPEHQFAGDTLWTFGTSLKAAYVNTFEFMNHAPVVQLWRDEADEVQAVSRISLGTNEWFHQATPAYRSDEVASVILRQADAALALLSEGPSWHTVRYESKTDEIELLEASGYVRGEVAEVFMERSLDQPIAEVPCPAGVEVRLLDESNAEEMHQRALAQVDAFTDGEPNALENAWITRSLPHQVSFGRPAINPNVIAIELTGRVLAVADPFFDRKNLIGEFEPVATRTESQGRGLSKAVMTRGLQEMRNAGMTRAVVRTGFDNAAAIAAYESVGFELTDHLVRFRKSRG